MKSMVILSKLKPTMLKQFKCIQGIDTYAIE